MPRLIPNENTWIGFAATLTGTKSAPKVADVTGAVDLTSYLISLNASSQGNTLPTPSFDTLFETSIPGTVSAQFSADFYRDDTADTAWTTLARSTTGYMIISRYGGSGTGGKPNVAADVVEVWPIKVTSRTMQNMASNQVMMFTCVCSVPSEPDEDAAVVT